MSIIEDASYSITFKFDGYFSEVKCEDRKRYQGGKQKTLKIQREKINFCRLKEESKVICPWLTGDVFDLHYHVSGTSPKVYVAIISEDDVTNMLLQINERKKLEIVIVDKLDRDFIAPQNSQVMDDSHLEESHQLTIEKCDKNNLILDDLSDDFYPCEHEENQSLSVGSYFEDSKSFKHALRTNAILNNFDIKIIASDKSRVIATCSHRGCPWRIRACLCSDGRSFEVRKLDATHKCPGVNRNGNNQATITWVANEIKDIVKENPDITPKDINNNLEVSYGLSLSYMKAWRSREQAKDILFGSVDDCSKWVPKCLRPRGRPKKRRIKSCLEGTSQNIKNSHKCGRCGLSGHHRSTCKNPLKESMIGSQQKL